MHIEEKLVFVDLEAAGDDPNRHPIMQIAAIAVDSSLCQLESFEVKIKFDEATAKQESLSKNRYSRRLWTRQAVPGVVAAKRFERFLSRHATVDMVGESGKPYRVAQMVAHNAERYDAPFIEKWFKKLQVFPRGRKMALCTKQRALWLFDEDKSLTPPANFQLQTLCEYFGIRLRPEDAHDAFNDVRATVELYRSMSRSAVRQQAA